MRWQGDAWRSLRFARIVRHPQGPTVNVRVDLDYSSHTGRRRRAHRMLCTLQRGSPAHLSGLPRDGLIGQVQQWAILSQICVLIGALMLGGGVVIMTDAAAVTFVTIALAYARERYTRAAVLLALGVLYLLSPITSWLLNELGLPGFEKGVSKLRWLPVWILTRDLLACPMGAWDSGGSFWSSF